MQNKFDFDYIIIGSGFGGSVAAHRLTEKGYRVAILETGKRFADKDFAKSTWNFRKYFWFPIFKAFGILRMTIFKEVFVLSGAGVGGGSLVYANTLLVPKEKIWKDPNWEALNNWAEVMPKFFAIASTMLGVTINPYLSPPDQLLEKVATKLKLPFYPTQVGVYFGKPGIKTADPYFNGEGPDRTGCTLCGACMVGCREGAKNTLLKNYLYFAEKNGAKIIPETFVTDIQPLDSSDGSQGYKVTYQNSTQLLSFRSAQLTAKGVVVAAGVLGTLKLLLSCQQKGTLKLSPKLGELVRTNSESILGVRDFSFEMGQGVAIGSGIYLNEHTHIEAVRFPKGSDALSLLSTHLPIYTQKSPILLNWIVGFIKRPLQMLKNLNPFGWAASTLILLVMQTLDNSLTLTLRRNLFFMKTLQTKSNSGIKAFLPEAQSFVHSLAGKSGIPLTTLTEIFLKIPTTAHILGGATMGLDDQKGVVNFKNEVFNYRNLYICDGSVISANLGVNPSLTIAALTEHAMSHIPENKMYSNETHK